MNKPPVQRPRSWVRRWGVWAVALGLLIAVSATIPWFETPTSGRYLRLARIHEGKADECRRLERAARASGLEEEARLLARSAGQFDRFSAIYRGETSRHRLSWLTKLLSQFSPWRRGALASPGLKRYV